MQKTVISIKCDDASRQLANQLAEFLNAPIIEQEHLLNTKLLKTKLRNTKFLLEINHDGLSLRVVCQPKLKPFCLNFNIARPGKGKDPLLRAIGANTRSVIDATAGWCADALHIARHGIKVLAIEQNRIVVALATHAAQEMDDPNLSKRFTLMSGNSIDLLNSLAQSPDVIYLDPMYPEKNKKSATRKQLMLLRDIVGAQENSQQLFERAMAWAKYRVVVKRPHYAAPLASGKVGETRSKLVRFDIYKPYIKAAHVNSGTLAASLSAAIN